MGRICRVSILRVGQPIATAAVTYTFSLMAITALLITLEPPTPPSARFWLGTDEIGRDLLSRIIFGARVSVVVGLAATTLATLVALFIGMVCGYIGGKFDLIVQRFVDAVMCMPFLILLIVIIAMIGPGMWPLTLTLGLLWGVGGSRVMRSAVIAIKENVYVTAAVAIGCPTRRILTRHILPNIMAPLIIYNLSLPVI
ncbi:hypothetical protein ES703_121223 [subsurface metagenome]